MVMFRSVPRFLDYFDRNQVFTTTAGMNGWASKLTKTAGTPTSLIASGVGAQLSCDTTNETQVLTLYQGDVLSIPLNGLKLVDLIVQLASADATTTGRWGVASAENNTPGSVSNYAWFGLIGSTSTSAIIAESSDGTNTFTAQATGQSLITTASTFRRYTIDFTKGLSDVRFYIDGQRVAAGTTFNMSAASATQYVQPYFQVGKTDAGAPVLTARRCEIIYDFAAGN